ncbi:hypothetical protein KCV07_g7220, partial [Aureobasidium melanogenum]
MSAPGDLPPDLQYRPVFDSLPYVSDTTSYESGRLVYDAFQSFPFLPGFESISFEEQRLQDMSPPSPMATGKAGKVSPSALRSLKVAYPGHEDPKDRDSSLLEPLLPIVIIHVGKGENTTAFAIHKNILEHCSPFFNSMWIPAGDSNIVHELNPREGSVNSDLGSEKKHVHDAKNKSVIEMGLDVDVTAFRLYTEWVYSGRIQKGALEVSAEDIDFSSIGQAYILGEKLQDQKFKNAVINLLLQTIITQGMMDLTFPTLVFKETSASAPLRRLLVDLYVCYGYKDWLKPDGSKEAISGTFLSDLSAAFFDRHGHDGVTKAKVLALNPCNYHEHPDGKACSNSIRHPRAIFEPKSEP